MTEKTTITLDEAERLVAALHPVNNYDKELARDINVLSREVLAGRMTVNQARAKLELNPLHDDFADRLYVLNNASIS